MSLIDCVVVGRDNNVKNDYSKEIIELCIFHNIQYIARENFFIKPAIAINLIAIAVGWRWLIQDVYEKIIVFHDSILPKYRGFNPLVTALLNKDRSIGVSVILAGEDFDCGNILAQKTIPIQYPITIAEAIEKIGELYSILTKKIFEDLISRQNIEGLVQNHDLATYSVWRDEDDYLINWNWSASEIEHFINCVSFPYKGASARLSGRVVRVNKAYSEKDVAIENRGVGKVLFVRNGQPLVICGDGLLRITELISDDGINLLPLEKFRVKFE